MAQKQLTRRHLGEEARRAALEGNWEDAITLNQQIIDRFQKDAEAFNRLGRAYLSLGDLDEAKDAYTKALRADPANLIARRNCSASRFCAGTADVRRGSVADLARCRAPRRFWKKSARPGSMSW